MRIALAALTRNGARLAQRMRKPLDADIFILKKYLGEVKKPVTSFDSLKDTIPLIFSNYDGIVCIMASGIVVRMIAPLLVSKDVDPAVVVMDEKGMFAISLLSGHLGGGNELAERCAFITGARAVITTATDVNDLPSFDMLAKDNGWRIENLERIKRFNSLLLDNEEIAVVDSTGAVKPYFHGRGNLHFFDSLVNAARSTAKGLLLVSNAVIPPQLDSERILLLRPSDIAVGIGCNRGTPAEEIIELINVQMKRLFLSTSSIRSIASVDAKCDEAGLIGAAKHFGVNLITFSSEELNSVEAPSPPSYFAKKAVGAKGVAEPAAILASGEGDLILAKQKNGNVTIAIAELTNR